MTLPTLFHTPTMSIVAGETTTGYVAIAVGEDADRKIVVRGVSIGHRSALDAAKRLARLLGGPLEPAALSRRPDARQRLALDVLDRLVRYCDGEPVSFEDVPLALDHLSPFQRRVAAACRAIPYGSTRTYGQVAAAAGSAGAARAVGQVMASNRFPLIVPCHRVVASGGKLGGFSAPRGLSLKRRLLALEGGSETFATRSASRGRQRALAFTS